MRGHRKNGDLPRFCVRSQQASRRQPGGPRKLNVHHHEVKFMREGQGDPFVCGMSLENFVSHAAQQVAEQFAIRGVVLDK